MRFIPGNGYITVKLLERFPPDSSTCFKLDGEESEWKIDAEAVIARNVRVKLTPYIGSEVGDQSSDKFYKLLDEEINRLNKASEIS